MLGDESEDEAFEVWPENWRALQVFLGCARSWDILAFPGGAWYHGIRPESMESVMRMSGVPRKERELLLADLQVMEAAAAPILNEKRDA